MTVSSTFDPSQEVTNHQSAVISAGHFHRLPCFDKMARHGVLDGRNFSSCLKKFRSNG